MQNGKKKKRSIKSNLLTSSFHPVSSPLRGGFCGRGRSRMRMRQKGGWEGRFVLCEMKQNNLWGLGFPSNLKRSSGKGRKIHSDDESNTRGLPEMSWDVSFQGGRGHHNPSSIPGGGGHGPSEHPACTSSTPKPQEDFLPIPAQFLGLSSSTTAQNP